MIIKILFWVPVLLMLHTYVVYPLTLFFLDYFFGSEPTTSADKIYPSVSVLMAVRNEESVIGNKTEALLSSEYPVEKQELLIGSDASDDKTNEILRILQKSYPQIKLKFYSERAGKPAIINMLSEEAGGEILIITDANVIPSPDTIGHLVQCFVNPKTGLADTRLINTGKRKEGISYAEQAYLGFESRLKYLEGKIMGTMMGPFGGFYAVRKSLYKPNADNILADDFRICMNVLLRGYDVVSSMEAIVYEDITDSLKEEFNRKVRISAGNFQNLKHFYKVLLRPFSKVSYSFVSHKVLRWISPVLWFIMIVTNILLLGNSNFYQAFFLVQLIFIILPPLDILLKRIKINVIPLRFFTHFYFMNIALFVGFVKYLNGIKEGSWEPTKRN